MYIKLLCLMFLSVILFPATAQTNPDIKNEIKEYTSNLPFESGDIKVPEFGNKSFNITDFGAVSDGHTINTEAINKTIAKCSYEGGGVVIVHPGLWITGPIQMQSNVNLHLERGAVILFSKNHSDFPIVRYPVKGFSVASPVYGVNLENVAISGEGILDGAGDTWRPVKKAKLTSSQWKNLLSSGGYVDEKNSMWYPSKDACNGLVDIKKLKGLKNLNENDYIPFRESMRPYMVMFINCKNVFLDGITIENSPKFALYPIQCENVIFRNVKINNEWWAQNGDAIDINACKNVLVYKCTINAGDDGICMKAGGIKNFNGTVLQNIIIADCIVYHAHGGFVIGSESDGGIKNISVKNCNFIGTDIGLRFKSAKDRGGLVENIFVDGVYMKNIVNEAVLFDFSYEQNLEENKDKAEKLPIFRNFNINNIICNGANSAVVINALPESPVKEIKISNSYFETVSGVDVNYSNDISFDKVNLAIKQENLISINQSDKINLTGISFSGNIKSFITVKGEKSGSVKVSGTNLSGLSLPVVLSPEVNKSSVEIK